MVARKAKSDKRLFLGLDLGTSAVKVGLFDLAGRPLHLARREYPLFTPRPGWVEQEPEDWWTAARAALREVLLVGARQGGSRGLEQDRPLSALPRPPRPPGRIVAVGLSGQAPSQVLVAADGAPLGRAILWSDRRATAEANWLAEHITPQQARAWTGYATIGGVAQPPARLLWLKKHRPDDWNCCAAVIQPKDFIALQLTGRSATDRNSSYSLFNPQTGRYHPDYLAALGIEPEKMPPVLTPTSLVGEVTAAAAAATGLPAGIPVVTGTIDAWCDIIGCGGITPGCAVDVAGTSEVVALVTDHPAEGEGVYSSPLLDDLYWVGGPTQSGGKTLLWLADGFYGGEADFGRLEAEAASVPPGAEGLLFLPYLEGERAPIWDEAARGAFVGLTGRHTRAHCARAVYEGVAFAVRDILERSETAAGVVPAALRVSGGGSRSVFWNQIKADVTGRSVQQMSVSDAASLGAALLAAVGVGVFDGPAAAAKAMVHPAAILQPVPGRAACYEALFAVWRELYPALRPTFQRLEAIQSSYHKLHSPA